MQTTHDVDLFNLVHELLLVQGVDEPKSELRHGDRHPYEVRQLMSPYPTDGELPHHTTFSPIECQDISPGGISFWSVQRPDYERLVFALGKIPFTFIEARVVHVTQCGNDRPDPFRVGCCFTGRVFDDAKTEPSGKRR